MGLLPAIMDALSMNRQHIIDISSCKDRVCRMEWRGNRGFTRKDALSVDLRVCTHPGRTKFIRTKHQEERWRRRTYMKGST